MPALEVGRVCIKIAGREAGKYAVVLKKIDNSFVLISGPKLLTGVKRRKCNIEHLEPTEHKLDIKEDASEEEVIEAYKKSGLITKLKLKLPSAAELKATAKPEKKVKGKPKEESKKEEEKKPKKRIRFKIGTGKKENVKPQKDP